jgi:hypothetical protein
MKTVTLADFLTDAEIEHAVRLYNSPMVGVSTHLIDEQIITPNIERINKALGQENDPRYLAYMVEYAITKAGKR